MTDQATGARRELVKKAPASKRAPQAPPDGEASGGGDAGVSQSVGDLLELAHDAFIVTSVPDGMVTYWSRGAAALYGWTAQEASGSHLDTLLGTVFPIPAPEIQQHVLNTGRWEGELTQTTRTGETIVVKSRWAARRDLRGKVEALLRINRDITAEKIVRAELARSEFRFRYMVENADEGIVQTSPTGEILFANQRFAEMLGIPFEGILGRSVFDFTDEVGYQLLQGQTMATHNTTEVTWLHANGEDVFTRVSAAAMRDQEGAYTGSLALVRDMAERRKAQELLDNLNQELERRVEERTAQLAAVNQELEAFAYSVSHDLRAPLRGIDGLSHALLDDYAEKLDDTGREYLTRLRASAQRMALLIDDMLTLSRVSRSKVATSEVDLGLLAQDVTDELRRQETARDVTLIAAPDLMAHADPRLMRIVLVNLIGNAWKFTTGRTPAVIELGAEVADGETTYFIRDNGVGFDMRYVSKLFTPFQRLHTQNEFPGSGVGLATVQRIIKRHGGAVRAEGVVDGGATIYFTLPKGAESE